MTYEIECHERKNLISLFEKYTDSTIVQSCLQGHMGKAWANSVEKPTVSQITVGIFVFYAGDPLAKEADELLQNLPDYPLVIVNTDEWKQRIETFYQGKVEKFQRYSFLNSLENFDIVKLKATLSTLPKEYALRKIDDILVHDLSFQALSEDFLPQFETIDRYLEKGIGYGIVHDGKVICGASSYSVCDEGIDIEIATHVDHRRKGLAYVAASALILDCIQQGKYPNWEAANSESVDLAQKLGYQFDKAYDTYFVNK